MLTFVLVAGTLAAAAAILVLYPLMRRREDARPPAAIAAVVVLAAFLLGGAGLYVAWSKYSWLPRTALADTPAAMTARLAQRLAAQPQDLEGWLLLGHSYSELEQFPLAVRAYQRADRLAQGRSVQALLGVAESLLAQSADQMNSTAGKMFERALELEPGNPKALFYSAFAALARGEPALARERFAAMQALNPPPQIREIIGKAVAELDAQAANASAVSPAATGDSASAVAENAATVSVRITLAPALAARVPADATLFVAARDPKAPGPPFAAKRLSARFPLDVQLTAADAMLPSRHIMAGQTLEIVARVALGGTPTATSGDPFGQVSYHVGKDGRLNIVIDRLSP